MAEKIITILIIVMGHLRQKPTLSQGIYLSSSWGVSVGIRQICTPVYLHFVVQSWRRMKMKLESFTTKRTQMYVVFDEDRALVIGRCILFLFLIKFWYCAIFLDYWGIIPPFL